MLLDVFEPTWLSIECHWPLRYLLKLFEEVSLIHHRVGYLNLEVVIPVHFKISELLWCAG